MFFPRQKVPPGLFLEFKKKQEELQKLIRIQPLNKDIKIIAGCDSSLIIDKNQILSIFVIFSYPELETLEVEYNVSELSIPYVPGFLSFREIPNLLKAFAKVKHKPDLIFVDGNGIAHPRKMGIATNLGIELNIPTIGVAKHKLFGKFHQVPEVKGSYTKLYNMDEQLGFALRTKLRSNPVFISPGHLVSMEDSLNYTLATLKNYKLPEPTRIADKLSKEYKTKAL